MLYLAQVKKAKKGLLKQYNTHLVLLAVQKDTHIWLPIAEGNTISAEEANQYENDTLVLVNLGEKFQIAGTIVPAAKKLVQVLSNFSAIIVKARKQQEEIELWKKSLAYQMEELENSKKEFQTRLEDLELREQAQLKNSTKYRDDTIVKTILNPRVDTRSLIGQKLQEADLISEAQIDIAVTTQASYPDLRLGQILALRGWIKQQTADFFDREWETLLNQRRRQPLGYYLKSAGLLDERHIKLILNEQASTGIKFGSLAVLKGFVKQGTLKFFLKHLAPENENKGIFRQKKAAYQSKLDRNVLLIENYTEKDPDSSFSEEARGHQK
jgi:hypothetical protein